MHPNSVIPTISFYGHQHCDPRPTRRDNEYNQDPCDEAIYYSCSYIEDVYSRSKTDIQSRKICDYEKIIYYDAYRSKWSSSADMTRCRTRNYAREADKNPVLPEGWHPPLSIR